VTDIARFAFLMLWGCVNVTCFYAGIALLNDPTAPGGREWPFGAGVLFIGIASMLFEIFIIIDVITGRD